MLVTSNAVTPDGNDRLPFWGNPYLNTGVVDPSINFPGIQLSFQESLINGPGEDVVIFELTIGAGQTAGPSQVRQPGGVGSERIVTSNRHKIRRSIPAAIGPNAFLAAVEYGGTTDLTESTSAELAGVEAVANPKWHVVLIDLDWLGVPAWQLVPAIEIVSGDASRAVD